MPRRPRLLALLSLLVVTVAALVTACGGDGGDSTERPPAPPPLPDGSQLLTDSTDAMGAVRTLRFAVDVAGELPDIPFTTAQGQLEQEGDAKGTATISQGGQLVQVEFVLLDDTLYLRGPTGGFQELPASAAGLVYDPSVILDKERGIPAALGKATGAVTEAREDLGGVDSYRVRAAFPAGSLLRLLPGFAGPVTGQLWIDADDSRLVQARFPGEGGSVLVRFTDFDAPADISAPS